MSTPKIKTNVAENRSDLKKSILERLKAIATMIADSFLLAVWAVSTWFINTHILEKLELSGSIEQAMLSVFQWIFATSTLIPVLAYTIVDICKVIKHTWNQIRKG